MTQSIRLIAVRMTENRGPDSLESNVKQLMSDFGLWGFHVRNSIGSQRGWPDWVILGPAGALFRELKSERGQVTPEQSKVGARLKRAGLDWAVWRPTQLLDGTIAKQLSEIARKM